MCSPRSWYLRSWVWERWWWWWLPQIALSLSREWRRMKTWFLGWWWWSRNHDGKDGIPLSLNDSSPRDVLNLKFAPDVEVRLSCSRILQYSREGSLLITSSSCLFDRIDLCWALKQIYRWNTVKYIADSTDSIYSSSSLGIYLKKYLIFHLFHLEKSWISILLEIEWIAIVGHVRRGITWLDHPSGNIDQRNSVESDDHVGWN